MLDLSQRPEPPVRPIDPIIDLIEQGAALSDEEVALGEVGQAELDKGYIEAFAAYSKADKAYIKAYIEEVGTEPRPLESAVREETQKERNEKGNGKSRGDEKAGKE